LPRAPKAPDPDDRNGIEHEQPTTPDEVLARYSMPEGAISKPVSGYIYFHIRAKPKSIKSVELVYEGQAGTATLKLL